MVRCQKCKRKVYDNPCRERRLHPGICCDCQDEAVAGPAARVQPKGPPKKEPKP